MQRRGIPVHHGMCNPGSFFNDDPYNPDCMDSSDEYDEGIGR